ncbi:hypothetical protein SAMN03159434_104288 [Enterobacter sp. NFR05]|nr:hypothetical protein SAMN03159434_104288 [Enterobacter sp. NFR05]
MAAAACDVGGSFCQEQLHSLSHPAPLLEESFSENEEPHNAGKTQEKMRFRVIKQFRHRLPPDTVHAKKQNSLHQYLFLRYPTLQNDCAIL